jgi:hypothetical protein
MRCLFVDADSVDKSLKKLALIKFAARSLKLKQVLLILLVNEILK